MTNRRYASNTDVSSSRSRDEIERTLSRYGAKQFMYATQSDPVAQAVVGFVVNDRQVRFLLPLPDRDDYLYTPARGTLRSNSEVERIYEQAVKQTWRALALVIKAKLEAVTAEIVTFEDEFAMHMVLPDGKSVRDHVLPAINLAYQTGKVPKMLAIGMGE